MDYKHTCETIFSHFQGITNKSMVLEDILFGRHFFAPSFFYPSTTCPPIFLPVHIRFYPYKWRVDGFLHKAMLQHDKLLYGCDPSTVVLLCDWMPFNRDNVLPAPVSGFYAE